MKTSPREIDQSVMTKENNAAVKEFHTKYVQRILWSAHYVAETLFLNDLKHLWHFCTAMSSSL